MSLLEHTKLAHHVAHNWVDSFRRAGMCMDFDDLVQEAFVVCINAERRFDASRGLAFSTYYVTSANHHFAALIKRSKAVKTCSVNVGEDFDLLEGLEDEGANPELECSTSQCVERAIEGLSPLSKLLAQMLIDPPKFVKEQFAAVEAKRKEAQRLGIDERYPAEINIAFLSSLLEVVGLSGSALARAKDEVKKLELNYAV